MTMKLHFEPDLEYQKQAIEAVCDIFLGQEINRTEFTVVSDPTEKQSRLQFAGDDLGIGNRLFLQDDELLENLKAVQLRNGLKPAEELVSGDFTVEMETGTGKTYVYLRTIYELNKRYGFTKFVIVVPSIAIKEGVYKNLQITEEHFKGLFAGTPIDFFLYDSSKLGQVRNFATSSTIQVMVTTVGAINKKDVNNLYKDSEKTGGNKPIDLIRATHPILIVDEPQSVDGGLSGKGKDALSKMNPLCTLRYSATHVDKHHMVYKLDAVDAYEQKLVKQIEVAGMTVENAHNKPYVKLLSTHSSGGTVTAKVEIDIEKTGRVSRKTKTVYDGEDIEQLTGRALYANYSIGEITKNGPTQSMELKTPGEHKWLNPGQAVGDVDDDAVKRSMIRRTIKEHLDKEKKLRLRGIKVLTLFFIDKVSNYRLYDEDGNPQKGKYALMFEEEYKRWAQHPNYQSMFNEIDLEADARDVHEGYFSIDKKNIVCDTSESNQPGRDNAQRAYTLIMKDKEKLLGFETKLKFIFSHSALREGWDNPNVFQICSLREMGTERQRRQTIGRGLRLCVDQTGGRIHGHETNILTVIANENYNDFAEGLQKEIETETGIRFGIVHEHEFATIPVVEDGQPVEPLGADKSKAIWEYLQEQGYINARGKVQDTLRTALKDGTVELPVEFAEQHDQIKVLLKRIAGKLEVKDADERKTVKINKERLLGADFQALWERIKYKSTYRVNFDNVALIEKCTEAIKKAEPIAKTRLQVRKADLGIGRGGVLAEETAIEAPVNLNEQDIELPDLLSSLEAATALTRKSLAKIVIDSERLDDFKRNPQKFIELAIEKINVTKREVLVDGIKYQRIGEDAYYAQELFENEELTSYMHNLIKAEKSVYEHVVYDSEGVERKFAETLEVTENVKVYAKLPDWFKIPTPLGTYNPDWAVLVEIDGQEQCYFVVETKGTLDDIGLRLSETLKITCGTEHFKAVAIDDRPAKYIRAKTVENMIDHT